MYEFPVQTHWKTLECHISNIKAWIKKIPTVKYRVLIHSTCPYKKYYLCFVPSSYLSGVPFSLGTRLHRPTLGGRGSNYEIRSSLLLWGPSRFYLLEQLNPKWLLVLHRPNLLVLCIMAWIIYHALVWPWLAYEYPVWSQTLPLWSQKNGEKKNKKNTH